MHPPTRPTKPPIRACSQVVPTQRPWSRAGTAPRWSWQASRPRARWPLRSAARAPIRWVRCANTSSAPSDARAASAARCGRPRAAVRVRPAARAATPPARQAGRGNPPRRPPSGGRALQPRLYGARITGGAAASAGCVSWFGAAATVQGRQRMGQRRPQTSRAQVRPQRNLLVDHASRAVRSSRGRGRCGRSRADSRSGRLRRSTPPALRRARVRRRRGRRRRGCRR